MSAQSGLAERKTDTYQSLTSKQIRHTATAGVLVQLCGDGLGVGAHGPQPPPQEVQCYTRPQLLAEARPECRALQNAREGSRRDP